MRINIIAVGKLKPHFSRIFNAYKQKLDFYTHIHVVEIKEHNHRNPLVQRRHETSAILAKIPKKSIVILCSIGGKTYDSRTFTELLSGANITFVIGGSHGVIEESFENRVSFSLMTFPHQLFRIMLIEQIYRKFAINNNLKYHK